MAKMVKYVEKTHQWVGVGIVRENGSLTEVDLGVITTDKKLKETGAKQLFKEKELPLGLVAIEVKKLDDVKITYELDVESFKELAKVVDTQESHDEE